MQTGGNKDGKYHYIALDMGHKDATKQLIEVHTFVVPRFLLSMRYQILS